MDQLQLAPHPDLTRPDVTIILVNYNTGHLLEPTLSALEASRGNLQFQVIIVDNASSDGTVEILQSKYKSVELIENQINVGFGRANNQALPYARGRYLLLLNTDAFVQPDTLQKTVDFMDATPACGVLGVKLVGRDGSLQPSCRYFPTPWNDFVSAIGLARLFPRTQLVDDPAWDPTLIQECDWVPGCYYLMRRELLERVGLFDPRYFLYYEEVDHCRAVRQAGWKIMYYPSTQVIHLGGESAKTEGPLTESGRQIPSYQIESQLLYFRKHHGVIGLFTAVALMTLADLVKVFSGLVRHWDRTRAAAPLRHALTMFKLLVHTRLASRATR